MTNVAVGAEALLASLLAQVEGRGVDVITLRALAESMDAPLGESSERYRVTLEGSAATVEQEVATNAASFDAGQVTGVGAGPATVHVVQLGDYAASRPATLTINL